MTISTSDLWVVAVLGLFACAFTVVFYRPLQYITFDETSARVAGLPAGRLNVWLAVLTALTVALSMRIVGLLLVSAMMVIPVACALQSARSFAGTIIGGIHLWHYHGQRRADGIILRRPCAGRHNSAYRNGLVYFKLPEKQHG